MADDPARRRAATLFHGGPIFTASAQELRPTSLDASLHRYGDPSGAFPGRFAEAFVVEDESIACIGTLEQCQAYLSTLSDTDGDGAARTIHHVDLAGQLVLPSFIDAHTHVLLLGQSLHKLDLAPCKTLGEIQAALCRHAELHPTTPRILAKGWLQETTDNTALCSMIDEVVPHIPVYIESKDLHSHWLNTLALQELGIGDSTPNPAGGTIHRDAATGKADGLMSELANINIVWPALAALRSEDETRSDFDDAVHAYISAGYTGVIEMALDDSALQCFLRVRDGHSRRRLPIRIAAHYIIRPAASEAEVLAQVDHAIELFNTHREGDLQVVGIKLMLDGVIDACTAALKQPYSDGSTPGPIWPLDKLLPVVQRADAAGLQLALHAIGDEAVHIAVEAIASLVDNPAVPASSEPRPSIAERRHRIEHLELTDPADVEKLGQLGITASVQPVHSDPAIVYGWYAQISTASPFEHLIHQPLHHSQAEQGDRTRRAFTYRHFVSSGAPLAIGSDTPTASHLPLLNLFNAVTRRSTRAVERAKGTRTTPEQALPLATAIAAATCGAARSCFWEATTGSLQTGKSADFVVVDLDLFRRAAAREAGSSEEEEEGAELLSAHVQQTWFRGELVYERQAAGQGVRNVDGWEAEGTGGTGPSESPGRTQSSKSS